MRTYHGSCECGAVQIETTLNLSKGTFKCNCRMCTKSRFWGAEVSQEDMKIISGESSLTRYSTSPTHFFCSVCGVKIFGQGELPNGKKMIAINLGVLDDLDPREWAKAPVQYVDGRHDRFDRKPEFTDHL